MEPTTTRYTVWEYEFRSGDGGLHWIEEDDVRKASWKAAKETGRIRSREVTVSASPWVIVEQDMFAPRTPEAPCSHQHERWQIREYDPGFYYCAACGERLPEGWKP